MADHENSLASSTVGSTFSASVICLRDNWRWRDNSNSHHNDVYRTYITSKSIVGGRRIVLQEGSLGLAQDRC